MSFPRQQFNGMPNYVRQNSYDTSSSHHAPMPTLDYQQSALPPPPPPPHQSRPPRFAPGPSSAVQRNQTVRGAVRGTTREAGANPHLVQRALTRGKTLTRPERFVAPAPLINPGNSSGGAAYTTLVNGVPTLTRNEPFWDPWGIFVNVITFWAPGVLLSAVGLKDKFKQRAWKEKVALCSIAIMLGGVVGFVTIGLTRVLCPVNGTKTASAFTRLGTQAGYVGIEGWNFEATSSTNQAFRGLALNLSGSDVSNAFDRTSIVYPGCAGQTAKFATSSLCGSTTNQTTVSCSLGVLTPALLRNLVLTNASMQVGYDWNQLALFPNYLIIDGNVLNLTPYLLANPLPVPNDVVDTAIRYVLKAMVGAGGKDVTRLFYNRADLTGAVPCLVQRYYAGHIDKVTPGCFISQLFLYVSLVLIMTIVMARFFMAALFSWVLSARLVTAPKNLKRHVISPAVMPEGANIDVDNRTGAAPWTNQAVARQATQKLKRAGRDGGAALEESKSSDDSYSTEKRQRGGNEAVGANGMISMASIGAELFCVCLVTCYSEGEDSIKTTLDSIAGATYSDARKLLFVVCDGMITGSGEKVSTPDICVAMIEADPRFGEPQALSYVAIGDGSKAHNQAMVYAGHYTSVKGHRTPTIIVVKCGTSLEADEKKPGNRGKRDSQMILMNFFSRVTYNDRMCPLDYDLFRKVQSLMGVTPDFFEVCLMVDADTKIYPESLGYLVRTMQNDNMIMGVCGETRIANKRQSWVTAIQVFEYFISHHLAKAFESVFGGVTCLPGCFSMYRLKARKQNDGDWFPVLVQPQIVSEYSQSVVTTLHQKNLLLLGEDRFLTTLLLRTFPNRKMMFCPQARCRTVAPDTFAVLLSQRRRWINSTVHNLMELVLVRNLCGTFVFSMQFVVFVDLIGTVVLPVAICLTYTLIINYIFNPPASFSDAIPLMLLGAVLGLPAILILITSFKIVYVGWMLIYLIALPIWNFVLPVYAFSKFDDFSWGETRKVEGDVKGEDAHGIGTGTAATVPLRRWEDWERSRLRTAKRRKEFERRFGSKHFYGGGTDGASSYEDSVAPTDSGSMMSHDDDMWGMQIGAYTEDGPTAAPPPVGLYNVEDDQFSAHETIDASDLEAALEQGWAEDPSDEPRLARRSMGNSMGNLMGSSSRGDSYYHTNSGNNTPPAPPKLYSLSDGPFMSSSYSNSSQQALVGNAASYSTSSFAEYAPGPMSPNGSTSSHPVYPQHSTMQMGNYPPGMSTSVSDRNFSGGHAKQRSGSNEMNFERRERGTPSPSRERQFERDAQYHQQQGYGQGEGRRLA